MLKWRIAIRTWAEHDENTPGYVEIDLVALEGGNPRGRFCFTLTSRAPAKSRFRR